LKINIIFIYVNMGQNISASATVTEISLFIRDV